MPASVSRSMAAYRPTLTPWDCTVPESIDDTDNGTYQIYIECELPDGTTERWGPSLDADDRETWEFGSNDDKDLMVAAFVEQMKDQYDERTRTRTAPTVQRGKPLIDRSGSGHYRQASDSSAYRRSGR